MTLIIIYLLSIIGVRKMCRLNAKHEIWLEGDCTISFMWFFPVMNTVMLITMFILFISALKPNKTGNKTIDWLTNKDLL